MKRNIKFTIKTDIRKARRKHKEHQSGAGEYDSRPKRKRTRERENDQWREDNV